LIVNQKDWEKSNEEIKTIQAAQKKSKFKKNKLEAHYTIYNYLKTTGIEHIIKRIQVGKNSKSLYFETHLGEYTCVDSYNLDLTN
jgi:hypothetical protein